MKFTGHQHVELMLTLEVCITKNSSDLLSMRRQQHQPRSCQNVAHANSLVLGLTSMAVRDMSSNSCCTSECADALLPAMRSRKILSLVAGDMHCISEQNKSAYVSAVVCMLSNITDVADWEVMIGSNTSLWHRLDDRAQHADVSTSRGRAACWARSCISRTKCLISCHV